MCTIGATRLHVDSDCFSGGCILHFIRTINSQLGVLIYSTKETRACHKPVSGFLMLDVVVFAVFNGLNGLFVFL